MAETMTRDVASEPLADAATEGARDYQRIAAAIRYLDGHRSARPSLEDVARHVSLSPHHFQRMFRRWCGLTPKQFLGYLTVEDAKPLLDADWPVLEVSEALGLSGPARLHDAFLSIDAVTPGEYKRRGEGLALRYGVYPSRFGDVLVVHGERGICQLGFTDGDAAAALAQARQRFAQAGFAPDEGAGEALVERAFAIDSRHDLRLHLCGTNFQVKVWSALLAVRPGDTVGYGEIARRVGKPRAARAVGNAVGANPVAWLVPCHRVIRAVGGVGGYRWGEERKRIMLAYERSRATGCAA